MAQAKARTTVVRIAVARFESTWATPTLASRAVAAANTAESRAHPIHVIQNMVRGLTIAGGDFAGIRLET